MNPFDKRPDWTGATVAILGSGPSMTPLTARLPYESHRIDRLIALNRSYELAPWADVIYAGDFLFWKQYHERIKAACPHSEYWTQDGAASDHFDIQRARGMDHPGFGTNAVHNGGNSGYQAINLAIIWGATTILLLGFDMKERNGKKHYFGDHERGLIQSCTFDEWLHKFKTVKLPEGVRVINCTPDSALTHFEMGNLEDWL